MLSTSSTATLTADTAHISFSTRALSNVGDVMVNAGSTVFANTVSTTSGTNISFSGKTVSNVDTLSATTATVTNLTTTATGGIINVSGKVLSNVSVLEVDSIRNAAASDVNFNYQALSNVAMVQTPVITTAGANISLDGKTLSNALAISTAMITSDNANIDVDSKVLSNVLAIETPSITSATTAAVQFTGKGLSNLGDVLLNAGSTLKANTITTTDGRANIDLSTRGRPWS